jgi:hypothetical protein
MACRHVISNGDDKGCSTTFMLGRCNMANITITDLRVDRTLDREAMSHVRGGDGAPWIFGSFRPYLQQQQRGFAPVVNFYQINNYADQMINQYQIVDVKNTAPNSVVSVGVDERSTNNGLVP